MYAFLHTRLKLLQVSSYIVPSFLWFLFSSSLVIVTSDWELMVRDILYNLTVRNGRG